MQNPFNPSSASLSITYHTYKPVNAKFLKYFNLMYKIRKKKLLAKINRMTDVQNCVQHKYLGNVKSCRCFSNDTTMCLDSCLT